MQQSSVQTELARDLRQRSSAAEKVLWGALRDRRFAGLKFRRHAPIGPFIVDFLCVERPLILEIDGGDARDVARDGWLIHRGYAVVQLAQRAILADVAGCLWRFSR